MSTKIKFDRHSIKFRLWMYFIGIGVGILLLVWFLQIFFLNKDFPDFWRRIFPYDSLCSVDC